MQARWCRAQLESHVDRAHAVRQPWPESSGVEDPDAWTDAVEDALVECELGAELELVECSEYPCVAALRPEAIAPDDDGRKTEMKRLMAGARACAPLRDAFGLGGPEDDEAIDVYRLDARCGDEREPFYVLSAVAIDGPAWSLLSQDPRNEFKERDLFRWLYRRADDVSAKWPCEG